MNKEIDFKIHNRWDIEVVDAKTGKVKQRAQAENVITNNWWSVLEGGNLPATGGFFFGSGSGTPSASDNALFHQEGYVSSFNSGSTDYKRFTDGVAWIRRCHKFTELQQVGVTFSELGLRSSNAVLTTHAMLTDMNGNPVTITKTDSDIFYIYATVYTHWNTRNNKYMLIYYDTGYPIIAWALGQGGININASLQCYKFNAHESYSMMCSTSTYTCAVTYDTTNKKVTLSFESTSYRIPVGAGNNLGNVDHTGGIGAIRISLTGALFTTEDFYDGDDIVGEAIGTGDGSNTRFFTNFDLPENAKVYVNGVQKTSGVTVRRCCSYVSRPASNVVVLHHTSNPSKKIDISGTCLSSYINYFYAFDESIERGQFNGLIFENKNNVIGYTKVKLKSIYHSANHEFYHSKLYGSNDMSNWTLIFTSTDYSLSSTSNDSFDEQTFNFSNGNGNYKYYKVEKEGEFDWWTLGYSTVGYPGHWTEFDVDSNEDGAKIIFDTAPAEGDVITADYHTPLIAKDSDHVFDFGKFSISYGPYIE